MQLAQQLYEGVDVKGHGTIGLITYLRTDSTRISEEADKAAKDYIDDNYGEEFVAKNNVAKSNSKKIQDAHEAIRPTYVEISPNIVKDSLTRDAFRLYQLIWRRFVASRMEPARYETNSLKVKANAYQFSASTSNLVFEGFMKVYIPEEEEEKSGTTFGDLKKGDTLELLELNKNQHFTQAPAHYTEASLVKTLEELGIGRPSTYAPTITTIIARRYIAKEKKNLFVTELGEAVNNIMKLAFPSIVDVHFTANMETLLDGVEEGAIHWKSVVRNFFPDLDKAVKEAHETLDKIEIADEVTDEICELCGRNMVIKYGPHGKFLACPGFPDCKNTKPYLEKIGVACPTCGSDIVIRKTKKGRRYYGCINNPECEFMSWAKPSNIPCEKCNGFMVEKGKKLVCENKTCGHVITNKESEE